MVRQILYLIGRLLLSITAARTSDPDRYRSAGHVCTDRVKTSRIRILDSNLPLSVGVTISYSNLNPCIDQYCIIYQHETHRSGPSLSVRPDPTVPHAFADDVTAMKMVRFDSTLHRFHPCHGSFGLIVDGPMCRKQSGMWPASNGHRPKRRRSFMATVCSVGSCRDVLQGSILGISQKIPNIHIATTEGGCELFVVVTV